MNKSLFLLPIFVLATAFSLKAQNDGISRFFKQYSDDERFTMVYISPKLFQMFANIETNDEEWNVYRDVVKDLGGLRILTAEDSIGDAEKMYKTALSMVPQNEYAELITVRDGKENVRIWTRETGNNNVIDELLLLVGSPSEFTLLSFTGKIDLAKISKIAKKMDINGMEHLDKIKTDKTEAPKEKY